jgi:hypothetical protein
MLQLAAVGVSAVLFPFAPTVFVHHAVGAILSHHLLMPLSPLMDANLLFSVDLLST